MINGYNCNEGTENLTMKLANQKALKKRVDLQASFITAAITLLACISVFLLCFFITYSDTIHMHSERVEYIRKRIDHNLNMATFSVLNDSDDMKTIAYQEAKAMLTTLRETTGANFIFTAKEAKDGTLIYLVDSLNAGESDFRQPGERIEPEILEEVRKAVNGDTVLPNRMCNTPWGKFFWAYFPAVHNGEVVGAICIAFDAENQYDTYVLLGWLTPLVCIIFCAIAVLISFHVFRRISNPDYKDIYNTDVLTGLKNRNSFEVDLNNLNVAKDFTNRAILSIDLNNLKKVNDTLGHSVGDRYIKGAAELLSEYAIPGTTPYRTGGDEFTVLAENVRESQLQLWIQNLQRLMREYKVGECNWNSMAVGYAIYNEKLDEDLIDTYKRADSEMYKDKQRQKHSRGDCPCEEEKNNAI